MSHPGRVATGLALVAVFATACSSGTHSGSGAATSTSAAATSTTMTTVAPTPTLDVRAAPWRLPRPSARAVLTPSGGRLLLVGGLDGSGGTTAAVLALDPATGAASAAGSLTVAVHDAALGVLGGTPLVFGGGSSSEHADVQTVGTPARIVGRMPSARSDLGVAVVGGRAYVVGGYDGATIHATALATADGVTFTPLGDLPVGVRYPAVAARGTDVWIVGGSTASGATDVVQVLDTRTGTTRVVAHLPATLSDAMAVTLHGDIYVIGGRWAGTPSADVRRLDAASGTLTTVGALPAPVTDAAVAVLGDTAYVVGGDAPGPSTGVSMVTVR